MSKRHDDVFNAVLSDLDGERPAPERAGARFLRRQTAMSEQVSGERQEKVLRLVDPAECRMWALHNRAYDLLTEENCRDLIDGIRAQGGQEFPAIVRRLPEGEPHRYEVICGARRHFAVTWLRTHNYPQVRFLIEERELTDEEAFRLADIENRERQDLSDYERALDYRRALDLFYGGMQKDMAERLEMSPTYLSRLLDLAKLPEQIVEAFASIHDLKEAHARKLKPMLVNPRRHTAVLAEAARLKGQGLAPAEVMARLEAAGAEPKRRKRVPQARQVARGLTVQRKGNKDLLEFDRSLGFAELRAAFNAYMRERTREAVQDRLPIGNSRLSALSEKAFDQVDPDHGADEG